MTISWGANPIFRCPTAGGPVIIPLESETSIEIQGSRGPVIVRLGPHPSLQMPTIWGPVIMPLGLADDDDPPGEPDR